MNYKILLSIRFVYLSEEELLKKEAEGFIVDEEVEEEEEAEDSDSNVEEKEDEDSDMDIRNEVADLLEQVNDN